MTNLVILGLGTSTFIPIGLGGKGFTPIRTATADLCVTTKLDSDLCK